MKKLLLLATAALLVTGVTFADNGKKKRSKKCAKGQSCCSKDKAKTAESKSCCSKDKKTTAKL